MKFTYEELTNMTEVEAWLHGLPVEVVDVRFKDSKIRVPLVGVEYCIDPMGKQRVYTYGGAYVGAFQRKRPPLKVPGFMERAISIGRAYIVINNEWPKREL